MNSNEQNNHSLNLSISTPTVVFNYFVVIYNLGIGIEIMIFNFLIILVISKLKLKTYGNYLYMSMALSDFFIGFGLFIFTITRDFAFQIFSLKGFYFSNVYLINMSSAAHIYSLLALTFHRYKQIIDPFKEKAEMVRKRYITIVLIWIISIIAWLIAFWPIRYFTDNKITKLFDSFPPVFATIIFATFTIPVVFIVLFNFLTIYALFNKTKNLKVAYNSNYSAKLSKEKRATYCITLISLMLVGFWTFTIFIWPFDYFFALNIKAKFPFDNYLTYFYPAFHPFVLFGFNKSFRNNLKLLYYFRSCRI